MGRPRQYYGLTLRGLHYALENEFVGYKDVKSLIQKHMIEPKTSEKEVNEQLKMQVRLKLHSYCAFYGPFLVLLGAKGANKIVYCILEEFPEDLFGEYDAFGQLALGFRYDTKNYVGVILNKAIPVLFTRAESLPESKLVQLLGEETFLFLEMVSKRLEEIQIKEIDFLQMLPVEQRNKVVEKLKQIR